MGVCPGSVKTDVAKNAVTADGSLRGYSDPNIDSGLSVEFCCDRILAAVHCGLDEIWIAKSNELQGAYAAQYFPDKVKQTMKSSGLDMIRHTMGPDYVNERLGSRL